VGTNKSNGYDAAGNTNATFTFYDNGRMGSAAVSAGTTTYIYNALNQLIKKSGNGGTTVLMYDEAGHLLGEYTGTGALVQETIWMGDIPIATLRPSGSTIAIYYVYTPIIWARPARSRGHRTMDCCGAGIRIPSAACRRTAIRPGSEPLSTTCASRGSTFLPRKRSISSSTTGSQVTTSRAYWIKPRAFYIYRR
jgi:YD repeat-containing protein